MRCLICNGTGFTCNLCGEAENVCDCDEFDFVECESCAMDDLQIPSPEEIAKIIKTPLKTWPGKCHEIALKMIKTKIVPGKAIYGQWLGEIDKDSIFGGSLVHHHGWIETPEGYIVDPTRYVFEHVKPYIFYGRNMGEYDLAGNNFRKMLRLPMPKWNSKEKQIKLPKNKELQSLIRQHLVFDRTPTVTQMNWLAGFGPDELGYDIIVDFYKWLIKEGHGCMIPIDNRNYFLKS